MTNEEKIEILNEAVGCVKSARYNMQKAESLLKKLGIELCDSFYFSKNRSHDIHLYKGISKLEKLTNKMAHYAISWDGKTIDKSMKELSYSGVKMIQVGSSQKTNYKFL